MATPGIVTLRFTSHWPWNPTSPVIARLGGSTLFSHSMAIIDGLAYEATMLHGSRVVPEHIAMQGVALYQDMAVAVPDITAGIQFGVAQDGKGYDWKGALGIPFLASTNWRDDSKWWCSEHNFMLVGAAGVWLLDKDERTRVTQNDLHQCNLSKSPIVRLK